MKSSDLDSKYEKEQNVLKMLKNPKKGKEVYRMRI